MSIPLFILVQTVNAYHSSSHRKTLGNSVKVSVRLPAQKTSSLPGTAKHHQVVSTPPTFHIQEPSASSTPPVVAATSAAIPRTELDGFQRYARALRQLWPEQLSEDVKTALDGMGISVKRKKSRIQVDATRELTDEELWEWKERADETFDALCGVVPLPFGER